MDNTTGVPGVHQRPPTQEQPRQEQRKKRNKGEEPEDENKGTEEPRKGPPPLNGPSKIDVVV